MIRSYRPTDLAQLLAVWERSSKIAHYFLEPAFFDAERERIAAVYVPAAETYVYEIETEVVGFIALLDHEIGGLFVDPDYQGQGIGRALVDYVQQLRGWLELDVFSANNIGRNFYRRYGFELVREHLHPETRHPVLRLRYQK